MCLLLQILVSFVLCLSLTANFSPDLADYDAYGMKVAANNFMIFEALNANQEFLIVFVNFTSDPDNYFDDICLIDYMDDSHYVYTVALGKNQSTYSFFFVGEVTNLDEYSLIANRTFIGMLSYHGSLNTIDCEDENSWDWDIQYVSDPYYHQEYLVMVTDPLGSVAYVFSNEFTLSYTAATKRLIVNRNNSLSPRRLFQPLAVDYDGTCGIIAGYLENNQNERM